MLLNCGSESILFGPSDAFSSDQEMQPHIHDVRPGRPGHDQAADGLEEGIGIVIIEKRRRVQVQGADAPPRLRPGPGAGGIRRAVDPVRSQAEDEPIAAR